MFYLYRFINKQVNFKTIVFYSLYEKESVSTVLFIFQRRDQRIWQYF